MAGTNFLRFYVFKISLGVPIVAQWVKNLTNIHVYVGSIPGLSQGVKDMALQLTAV